VSVDIAEPAVPHFSNQFQRVDLSGPWPWPDSSIGEVVAFDVIEHIGDFPFGPKMQVGCPWWPQYDRGGNARTRHPIGKIHFLNELHRVLIPGGVATIETPNAAHGVGYFQDPQHVSPLCLSTFKYFEHGSFAHTRLAASYGITAAFKVMEMSEHESSGEDGRERVWKIRAVMEAIK
jgi:hypothetical protein